MLIKRLNMHIELFWCSTLLVATMLLLPSGCSPTTSTPIDGTGDPQKPGDTVTLTLGDETVVASQAVPAAGGSVTVDGSGTPLDGLTIEVPAGAVPAGTTFTVSYRPIQDQQTPADVEFVGPLVHIDNGDIEADQAVLLTIPVSLAEDDFAMGFIYDDQLGTLEALPTVAQTTSSITIATSRFSNVGVGRAKSAAVDTKDANSGFVPGVDDWQAPNEGSYFAYRGHCGGETYTAHWHFTNEKPISGVGLTGEFQHTPQDVADTPNIWQDDVDAIRLCTIVQNNVDRKVDYDTWIRFDEGTLDKRVLQSVRYAISSSVPQQPQTIGVGKSWDTDTGHALLAYKVEGNRIYVADPNFPGKTDKFIEFDPATQKFKPYSSADSLLEYLITGGYYYNQVWFMGKSRVVEWNKLGDYYTAARLGNDIAEDPFPQYTLWIEELDGDQVQDRYILDTVTNYVEVTYGNVNIELDLTLPDGNPTRVQYCRYTDGKPVFADPPIALEPGYNTLGFYVQGKRSYDRTYKDNNGQTQTKTIERWYWLGFVWVQIYWDGEDPQPCTFIQPDLTSSSWHMKWDVDCQTYEDFTNDRYWTFRQDGSIADHWLGTISDVSWSADANGHVKIVSQNYDGTQFIREADLSADCSELLNGIAYTSDDPDTILSCWKASRRY